MRLLYVVTEDWYFLSHRLPMARAAKAAGFDVHVATRVQDGAAAIAAEGFTLHPIAFARGRLSPLRTLQTVRDLRAVFRRVSPDISHHVAVQCAVLGSLAALGHRVVCVNAMTGLGYLFTAPGKRLRFLQPLIAWLLRRLLDRRGSVVLVQNPDDRDAVAALGIGQERIALIPGSGVDTARLQPLLEPASRPAVGFVGRLLADKGIRTLVAAHRLLRQSGSDVELLIAGTPDPANPASVPRAEAASWNDEPGITWIGQANDIAGFWARAHVAVLPSRREGLPMSLLEAAACGRPMVATDVPGCREVARAGETGLLVPPDDAPALAAAIRTLLDAPELRARFGAAARSLAVERFGAEAIGRQTVDLYRRMLRAEATA